MIHKWERDAVQVSERYMLLYCKVFGVIPGQLSRGPRRPERKQPSHSVTPTTADPGEEAVQTRSDFSKANGAVAIGALLPVKRWRLSPTLEMTATCRALTENYRRLDALAGPAAVYTQATGHQAWLADWIAQAAGPDEWREVALLFADATILLAWLNFDLERYPQAMARYRECADVAAQLQDPLLRAFLAGRQARTLSECGRHADALGYADAARQLAVPSAPELQSWLSITRAYIHACLGDEYACLADVARARTALSKPGSAQVPPYLAFYGETYLAKWEGRALLKLGSVRKAAVADGRKAIDAALDTWAPDDIRESGEVLAACAAARHAQQEIPEAARLAAQAWQVAAITSSPRIMRYVTQLRRDLVPWRDVGAVRELDDLIFGAG
jgi:tetratricopeptide (TPR) repeat protein